MPRCAVRHVKLVAEAELPILPFLAPRVFQPWPCSRPRSSVTAPPSAPDQRKSFSSTSCRNARQPKPPLQKDETARSRLARRWYQQALAPEDRDQDQVKDQPEQQPDQSAKDFTRKDRNKANSTRPSGREHARRLERTRLATSQATLKSRWTAANRDPLHRTKWASAGHPVRRRRTTPNGDEHELAFVVDQNFLAWNYRFATLNARHDSSLHGVASLSTTPKLYRNSKEWAKKILDTEGPLHFDALEKLLGRYWRNKWMHALLWTLANSVEDAARLLKITHCSPFMPASCIADALAYLAKHHAISNTSEDARQQLVDVFCTLMERPGASPLKIPGRAFRQLLKICTDDQIMRVFESSSINGAHMHWNTHLHFATYFAHRGHFTQALDALLDAVEDGADVTSSQFESNCATILRKAADQPDGLRISLRLVQNLSGLGVQLNVQLCNVVMLSAVEAGDLKTAFSIYHSLVENNLKADEYTHAILLKGCKNAIEDSETLNTTIRQAIADTEVLKSNVVSFEILHCLYLHHSQIDPTNTFSILADAFTQLFDTSDLIHLGVLSDQHNNRSEGRMQPSVAVLGIMITAYLRHFTHIGYRDTSQQYDMYRHWRSLAEQGINPYTRFGRTDHIPNAFLYAFIQHPSGLAHAAEVIRDMQTPPPANIWKRANPTVRSWSIFLHGFAKHGKMDLAEQVLTYMRGKSMEPNEVTWNSLLGGYAAAGKADKAVETFIRMRDAGFESTEVTDKALTKVRLDRVSPDVWKREQQVQIETRQNGGRLVELTKGEDGRQEEHQTQRDTQDEDHSSNEVSGISDGVHALSM